MDSSVGLLLIGISFCYRIIWLVGIEHRWLEQFRSLGRPPSSSLPRLITPLAAVLADRVAQFDNTAKTSSSTSPANQVRIWLSASEWRSLLDGVAVRLEENRDIARYLSSLLIFVGLLGTFWGLLVTIGSVSQVIGAIAITETEGLSVLTDRLAEPLSGMGTAFSSSLFGLAGSLIVGLAALFASQAQNRFFQHLEEWLSRNTRLTDTDKGSLSDAPAPKSDPTSYQLALLSQAAKTIERGTESVAEMLRRQSDSQPSAT